MVFVFLTNWVLNMVIQYFHLGLLFHSLFPWEMWMKRGKPLCSVVQSLVISWCKALLRNHFIKCPIVSCLWHFIIWTFNCFSDSEGWLPKHTSPTKEVMDVYFCSNWRLKPALQNSPEQTPDLPILVLWRSVSRHVEVRSSCVFSGWDDGDWISVSTWLRQAWPSLP